MTLPLWKAYVEAHEVQFGPKNMAAREAAEEVEYPWGKPLVEVSKVREALTSDEAIDAAFARVTPYPPDRRSDQYRYTREMVEAALDSVLGDER